MRRSNLPLGALRAFEAVGRLGRMTSAAEELAVTHGAISRSVKQLETNLGLVLIAGTRARPELTSEGQQLAAAASAAFDQIDAAVRALVTHHERTLEVACLSTFAMRCLIPRLHRFSAQHPHVQTRLSTEPMRAANVAACDVAILALKSKDVRSDDDILFIERIGLVVHPRLARDIETDRQALRRIPRLETTTRPDAWRTWKRLSPKSAAGKQTGATSIFEHYYFTIQAALSGLGASVAPLHLVSEDVLAGRLVAPFGFHDTDYRYVARRPKRSDRDARLFMHWLRSAVVSEILPPSAHTDRS